jgi:hypothetical protein
MADVRRVDYVGKVGRIADSRERFGDRADSIECLVVVRPDGSEDWQPIDRVRFVGGPWRGDVET